MKRSLIGLALLLISASIACAQEDRGKVVGRVQEAGNVLDQIMAAPDSGIPSNVIESAQCVAVVPSYLKAAFGFSGTYGRGVASCRTGAGWSALSSSRRPGSSSRRSPAFRGRW